MLNNIAIDGDPQLLSEKIVSGTINRVIIIIAYAGIVSQQRP